MSRRGKKATILCVDDDANVLEGLRLHLRPHVDVLTALSGSDGLEILRRHGEVAVVISDMRMPEMDGAEFLSQARSVAPHAVRALLSGFSDFDAALKAVNEGQVFRFISKPCAPEDLLATVVCCLEHHELLQAERTLLNHTLIGCVKVMLDLVGMAAPVARNKAVRIRDRISRIARANNLRQRWQLELSASLSQIGALAVLDSAHEPLEAMTSDASSEQLARANRRVADLIQNIPRLGPVGELLHGLRQVSPSSEKRVRLLGAVIAMDDMGDEGVASNEALAELARTYGDDVCELIKSSHQQSADEEFGVVTLEDMQPGMRLVEDLRTVDGVLLALEGTDLDRSAIRHLREHAFELNPRIRVVRTTQSSSSSSGTMG